MSSAIVALQDSNLLAARGARRRVPETGRAHDRPSEAREEWALQDSNLGRAGYEPAALTAELRARKEIADFGLRIANWSLPNPPRRQKYTGGRDERRAAWTEVRAAPIRQSKSEIRNPQSEISWSYPPETP